MCLPYRMLMILLPLLVSMVRFSTHRVCMYSADQIQGQARRRKKKVLTNYSFVACVGLLPTIRNNVSKRHSGEPSTIRRTHSNTLGMHRGLRRPGSILRDKCLHLPPPPHVHVRKDHEQRRYDNLFSYDQLLCTFGSQLRFFFPSGITDR